MVMGVIEPSLLLFLHDTELHLEKLIHGKAEEETIVIISLFEKSKRILQMLSLALYKLLTLMLMLC